LCEGRNLGFISADDILFTLMPSHLTIFHLSNFASNRLTLLTMYTQLIINGDPLLLESLIVGC